MAWIYLAVLEDYQSPLENGLNQSHTAKSTPIVREYYSVRCSEEEYIALQSGMTYEALRESNSYHSPLICYTEDSHARTSALQDAEKAWQESEADWFSRSCAWPKKSSPSSYSLRMSQQSQVEADFGSLEKLPKWGMIVDGALYPLRPLEHYTVARGGSFLPTPNTLDHMALRSEEALKRQFMTTRKGRTKPSNLREAINPECWPQNLFPTPSADEGGPLPPDTKFRPNQRSYNSRTGKHVQITIRRFCEAMFPTPQACDATKGPAKEFIPNGKQSSMRNLVTLVARFPTPRAHDAGDSGRCPSELNRNTPSLPTIIFRTTGKILNPQFVEWLMEYPIGWTELEDWGTQWCQAKRKKRLKS